MIGNLFVMNHVQRRLSRAERSSRNNVTNCSGSNSASGIYGFSLRRTVTCLFEDRSPCVGVSIVLVLSVTCLHTDLTVPVWMIMFHNKTSFVRLHKSMVYLIQHIRMTLARFHMKPAYVLCNFLTEWHIIRTRFMVPLHNHMLTVKSAIHRRHHIHSSIVPHLQCRCASCFVLGALCG